MNTSLFRFTGLDKTGYDSVLQAIKEYPRSKGEQIVVVKTRSRAPRSIDLKVRTNIESVVIMDLTTDVGDFQFFKNVWIEVED